MPHAGKIEPGYSIARRPTRTVMVGDVGVGGDNPIRVQSMISSATHDVESSVRQLSALVDAGCEIARLTVPTRSDLEALPLIRLRLAERNITIPLVADIHYSPELAVAAVPWVDKIRINPGNYGEKKQWDHDLSDSEYESELEQVKERLVPLVTALKRHKRSLRIGTNHGSLSSRVLNRWGNSTTGMVVSALEYIEICEQLEFRDIIISMKASSPRIMIDSYRLLVQRLQESGRDYPLHLGVTEAGQGRDGVIRSAVGIGALLLDGIGDTIRVSLTDHPAMEIEPALAIIQALKHDHANVSQYSTLALQPFDTNQVGRRVTSVIQCSYCSIGGDWPPVVAAPAVEKEQPLPEFSLDDDELPALVQFPDQTAERVLIEAAALEQLDQDNLPPLLEVIFSAALPESELAAFRGSNLSPSRTMVAIDTANLLTDNRLLAGACEGYPLDIYCGAQRSFDSIELAMHCGALLLEGIGDALTLLGSSYGEPPVSLAYAILQGTGRRLTRAEIISCPTCGRTRFDLAAVTAHVRELTGHLRGLKIAVMGCVVNGPGEMADADFGYVGAADDKVHLYRAGELVRRDVPTDEAALRLVELIKEADRWHE
jgi:(E)-4-hydroxy-3-methylbut-2-enyl-diphosphate synthase